ncbi:MAG TPA: GtrA family protein [Nitrososphaerales archaeon]|nr:GtrA family protein [Nitrososphaerales archaeon]
MNQVLKETFFLPFEIHVIVKITSRPIRDVMLDLKDYVKKGFKFMVIGAVGSVVNLGMLYFLVQYFKLWYIWAEVISILVAFAVNYNGNILVKNINVSKNVTKEIPPPPAGILEVQKSENLSAKPGD